MLVVWLWLKVDMAGFWGWYWTDCVEHLGQCWCWCMDLRAARVRTDLRVAGVHNYWLLLDYWLLLGLTPSIVQFRYGSLSRLYYWCLFLVFSLIKFCVFPLSGCCMHVKAFQRSFLLIVLLIILSFHNTHTFLFYCYILAWKDWGQSLFCRGECKDA